MTAHDAPAPPQVPPDVAQRAVEWLVELQSEEADHAMRAAWQHWLAAHPDHERAWRHIEAVDGRWRGLASPLASATAQAALTAPGTDGRRRAVTTLALCFFAGGAAWMGERHAPWRAWLADERTSVGQRRRLALADGSNVTLNTDSALSIRLDATARRVQLAAGEIFVATGPHGTAGAKAPPFLVETGHGTLRALGTRFCVRLLEHGCRVAVFEGAVEVRTGGGAPLVLPAGQGVAFSAQGIGTPQPADDAETAWTDGMLIASGMRLDDFAAELQRYRRGILRCAREVADLRISGSYPLDDPDRVLEAVAATLSLRVDYMTRYWATLRPRTA